MGCTSSTPDSKAPPATRGSKGSKGRKGTGHTKRALREDESQIQTSITWLEKASLRTSGSGSDKSPGFLTVVCVKEAKAPKEKSPDKGEKYQPEDGFQSVTLVKEAPVKDQTRLEEPPRLTTEKTRYKSQ